MPATVAPLSLEVTRGEDRTFSGTHQTSATNTAAVDISGWTLKFTVKDLKGKVVLTKTPSVTSGPAGTYSFSVAPADTTINPGQYPCDLWRTDSGNATVMGVGTLTIKGDVRV